MSVTTIPLVKVYEAFKQYGFLEDEVTNILIGLVMIWRVNEHVDEITKEVIFTECDLDELNAQMLWNLIGTELVSVASLFRQMHSDHVVLRWAIHTYNIILELQNEEPNP